MDILFLHNLSELRQILSASITNCQEAYIGELKRKYIYIANEGGSDDGATIIKPSDVVSSGRWICPQGADIPAQLTPWNEIDKSASSLKDLKSRSASDLDSGQLHPDRLPNGVPYFNQLQPYNVVVIDKDGNYSLSKITHNSIIGTIPYLRIDFSGITPQEIGAEEALNFDQNYFNRKENSITPKTMSPSMAGIAMPGEGIETDDHGRINVKYGTGPGESLEGDTKFLGDLSGTHTSATVDRLRSIPLTFFKNELSGKDGYVLTLDVKNHNTPFFYLSKQTSSGPVTPVEELDSRFHEIDYRTVYAAKAPKNSSESDSVWSIVKIIDDKILHALNGPHPWTNHLDIEYA